MKKLVILILVLAVLFTGCTSAPEDDTSDALEPTNSNESIVGEITPAPGVTDTIGPGNLAKIELQYCSTVQLGGVAQISFTMNNKEYTGIINSKGEIFYYTEESFEMKSVGKKSGYISQEGKKGVINYETEKIIWFEKSEFDKIIGYGDNYILTYKSNSTINTSEHIYCVIDAINGTTVTKNTASTQIQHPYTKDNLRAQYDYIHVGDGWFLSKAELDDSWLYDSKNNVTYILDKSISVVGNSFADGKIYMKTSSYSADIFPRNSDGKGTYIDFPSSIEWYFLFDQKGYIEKVSKFDVGATGFNVIYKDVEYLKLIDTVTQKTYQYKNFSADMIDYVKAYDNYCLIIIGGADYKDYFTVINKKGEQLFEPIKFNKSTFSDNIKLSEDLVIYQLESTSSNMFDMCKIYDLSGKELFTIDYIGSDDVIEFYNEIVMNKDTYFDKFGNELTITIKE